MNDQRTVAGISPPIRAVEDDRALDEEGTILPKDGTCLVTAGAASSGKSTLQRALIHKLFTDEDVRLEFRDGDGEPLHDPELQRWIFDFDRGVFPDRTVWREKFQTFFIEFGQGQRLVRLSFAEISGEHFQALLPGEGRPAADLGRDLEHVLTTRDVKKLFVFVADSTRDGNPERSDEDHKQALYEDMMFSELLNQLKQIGLNSIRLLFVAAKWDEVTNRNQAPKRFFQRRFPQTRSMLRRFAKADVKYIRFSVGEVRGPRNGKAAEIVRHDEMYAARVANWIHHHATGRTLRGYPRIGTTLWEKVKVWAAK